MIDPPRINLRFSQLKQNLYRSISNANATRITKNLGIHFRCQEMRLAGDHLFVPTLSQVFTQVDQLFERQKFHMKFGTQLFRNDQHRETILRGSILGC